MGLSQVSSSQKLELWDSGWLELCPARGRAIRNCKIQGVRLGNLQTAVTNSLNTACSTMGNCHGIC